MRERQIVVKTGGGAMSVFGGLFLFFVVLPVVTLIGCFACTGGLITSVERAREEARENARRHAGNGDGQSPSSTTPAANPKTSEKRPGREATYGDVRVTILSATIGKVTLKEIFGDPSHSKDELLQVAVRIENRSATKKLEYRGWAAKALSFGSRASLADEHDNHYANTYFSTGSKVVGQSTGDSIYPGKSLDDLLVFAVPVAAAKFLTLKLSTEVIGDYDDPELVLGFAAPVGDAIEDHATNATADDEPPPVILSKDPVVVPPPHEPKAVPQPAWPIDPDPVVEESPDVIPEIRLWTDKKGRTFRGEFLRVADGKAFFTREDNAKTVSTEVKNLSHPDQDWIHEELLRRSRERVQNKATN